MREPFELIHNNRYRISCRPDPTPEGAFLARALVSWIDDDGGPLDHRLRPEHAPFASAADAAAAARDAAIRWLETLASDRPASAPPQVAEPAAVPAAHPAAGDDPLLDADRDAYLASHREWQAAAAAFEAAMQQALVQGGDPLDPTRTATDAAALMRLHERWLKAAVHLAVVRRR